MHPDVERLRRQLRNAERRLAAEEAKKVNVAAAYHGGFAGGSSDQQTVHRLNRQIDESNNLDALRDEIRRLRAQMSALDT